MSLNFLESSVDYLSKTQCNSSELQFSIIHLASAVELMLKARLIDEHWSLVVENSKDLIKTKFESGDFKSINIDEAIERIDNICKFKVDEKNKKIISRLKKARNKIIHIGSSVNQDQAKAILVDTYSFIYDFLVDSNLYSQGSDLEYKFSEIRDKINKLEKFVTTRLNRIGHELKKHKNTLRCPDCWQQAIVFPDTNRDCLFCRKKYELNEFLELYCEAFLSFDELVDDISECPECGENSVVFAEELDCSICLSCGSNFNGYLRCIDCDILFVGDSNYPICPDCIRNRFDNDQMMPAPEYPEDEYTV